MTLSSPSALAALTRPSIPPKSAAEVASLAFTPDSVLVLLSFSGGAHATNPMTTKTDVAAARSLDVDIAEPSDGQEGPQASGSDGRRLPRVSSAQLGVGTLSRHQSIGSRFSHCSPRFRLL